jgi:TPR repeat protein
MKKKSLIILASLGLLAAAGSGGATAWWWFMNQPEQLAARAQQSLTENRGNEAAELLTRLTKMGDMNAARQLAILYAEGKLVTKDETAAARYYLLLAEKGDETAQREMADRCEQGRGVAQSEADAARWLTPFAECFLAFCRTSFVLAKKVIFRDCLNTRNIPALQSGWEGKCLRFCCRVTTKI